MTPAQKKAVINHRKRQARKGNVRLEVSVPESDKLLIRGVAENLRAGGEIAERTRTMLTSVLNPHTGLSLKRLIESGPALEELDLKRSNETARDIDL